MEKTKKQQALGKFNRVQRDIAANKVFTLERDGEILIEGGEITELGKDILFEKENNEN